MSVTIGRPGGPLRLGLGTVAVLLLGFLAFVMARVDSRIGDQARVNLETKRSTGAIVAVNQRVAKRITEVDALTAGARAATEATANLAPVIEALRVATARANRLAGDGRAGAEATRASLDEVRRLVGALSTQVGQLGQSADGVVTQEAQVLAVLDGLAGDLDVALGQARRIRAVLDTLVPG